MPNLCCAAEGWPEHCQALQVPAGTAQHLLACCVGSHLPSCAGFLWQIRPLDLGPRMGLRCSCQLTESENHTLQEFTLLLLNK